MQAGRGATEPAQHSVTKDQTHSRIARHPMPDVVEFRDELPCSIIGKPNRNALCEWRPSRLFQLRDVVNARVVGGDWPGGSVRLLPRHLQTAGMISSPVCAV
jgi:hypothetical protein